MRSLSQKIKIFIIFSSVILILSMCLEPPNIEDFFNDDEIKEMIERDRVTLIDKTNDKLIVGNKIIVGLKSDKYYMVSVEGALDADGDPDPAENGLRYLNEDGELIEDIKNINKVSGGAMIGLNNDYTYTVWSTTPLTGSMTRYDISSLSALDADPPPAGISVTAGNTGISIPSPADFYYLDISSVLAAANDYKVFRVPVSDKDGSRGAVTITAKQNKNFIQLSRAYKKTDYLFTELDSADEPLSFKVLTVTYADDEQKEDGIPIEVTFTLEITDHGADLEFDNTALTVTQDDFSALGLTINVDTTGLPQGSTIGNFNWYYGINSISTNQSFTFNAGTFSAINYPDMANIGAKYFNVEFTVDGKYYSKPFTIMVTQVP